MNYYIHLFLARHTKPRKNEFYIKNKNILLFLICRKDRKKLKALSPITKTLIAFKQKVSNSKNCVANNFK